VREDAIQLFGFISQDELIFFKKLITVNGIGPKGALAILSSMSVDVLKYSILMSDAKSIAKAPGIGLKTAERLILDLRDKIKQEDVNTLTRLTETGMPQSSLDPIKQEAVEALVALGYLSKEAFAAVKAVTVSEIYTTEEVLKEALKHLF
jgi:holliday junction DNA helicase RuvA